MSRKAMQVALEALESDPISHAGLVTVLSPGKGTGLNYARAGQKTAVSPDGGTGFIDGVWNGPEPPKKEWVGLTDDAVFGAICAGGITEQEPVAEIQAEDMGKPFNAIRVTVHFYAEVPAVGTKLYKAPPKREWVGLTDEEIDYQAKKDDHAVYFALGALWAEAKLKEKNHG
jgi:hypothetical protein